MKIFLTSAYDSHNTLDVLRNLVPQDSVGEHQVCNSPEEADIILFVENAHFDDYVFKGLRKHPLLQQFPNKVYMFNEVDKPWCALPGLYTSMPKRYFQDNRQVSFGFFKTPNDFVKSIYKPGDTTEREFLFSFVGAISHRSRRHIMDLSQRIPSIQDTSDFNVWHCNPDIKASQGKNYASVMADSKFVLCPRGIGPNSFRLFEAMQAGRTPVIISDQWMEPNFVNWDFAVRIPEHDINTIPEYLGSIADEAIDRGNAARAAWEEFFAPDKIFNSAVDAIGTLKDSRQSIVSRIYLQNVRKIIIDGEQRFLSTARKMRDRLADVTVQM